MLKKRVQILMVLLTGIGLAGCLEIKISDKEDTCKMTITEEHYSAETENKTWQDAYKNIICNIESNLIDPYNYNFDYFNLLC